MKAPKNYEAKSYLSKSALGRMKVIDRLIRNSMRKYPTMEEIMEACEESLGYEPSPETIQKDIRYMKADPPLGFGAPIKFSRRYMGYEYTDPDFTIERLSLNEHETEAIEKALDLIQVIGGSRIGANFSHAIQKVLAVTLEQKSEKNSLPVLQTMQPPVSKGFEHFDLYYKSCKEQIPISVIHFSYLKREFKHIVLHPFLVKEFENRWYLIGYSEQHKKVRTFGIDRLSNPVLLKKEFKQSDHATAIDFLDSMYGVFPVAAMRKVKISLHVSDIITHYFHAYPLHPSQKIKKYNYGDSKITFDLIPTLELARFLLSQGRHVEVKSPVWFVQFTQSLKA